MATYSLEERDDVYQPHQATIHTPYFFDQFNLSTLAEDGYLEAPIQKVDYRWQSTLETIEQPTLQDPTSQQLRNPHEIPPSQTFEYNYTPYHLFCLKYQLYLFIRRKMRRFSNCEVILTRKPFLIPEDSSLTPINESQPQLLPLNNESSLILPTDIRNNSDTNYLDNDRKDIHHRKMLVSVDLYDGNIKLNLDPCQISQLQSEVTRIISQSPTWCPIYSIDLINEYPQSWLRQIVPHIILPEVYQPFYRQGTVYVTLQYDDFNSEYDRLETLYRESISRLWQQGTIKCSSQFAKKWNLVPILPYIPLRQIYSEASLSLNQYDPSWNQRWSDQEISEQQRLSLLQSYLTQQILESPLDLATQESAIYQANWIDTRLTSGRSTTEFLLSIVNYLEPIVQFQIGYNLVTHHLVSTALRSEETTNFIIDFDRLLIPISDFVKAVQIADIIFSNLTVTPDSRVVFIATGSLGSIETNLRRGHPSEEMTDLSVFRTLDPMKPWTLSRLITGNMTNSSLIDWQEETQRLRYLISPSSKETKK